MFFLKIASVNGDVIYKHQDTLAVCPMAKLVSAHLVFSRGLARCSGVNKQINLGFCLFLTGVREVTEPVDTSPTNGYCHNCHARLDRQDWPQSHLLSMMGKHVMFVRTGALKVHLKSIMVIPIMHNSSLAMSDLSADGWVWFVYRYTIGTKPIHRHSNHSLPDYSQPIQFLEFNHPDNTHKKQ